MIYSIVSSKVVTEKTCGELKQSGCGSANSLLAKLIAVAALGVSLFATGTFAAVQQTYIVQPGQSPTNFSITNSGEKEIYLNLVLGQPPTVLPTNCSNLGSQIISINDTKLKLISSVKNKKVTFSGPPGVTTKGAYQMNPGETITYQPQTFTCFEGSTCTPAITGNVFFTNVNGTTTGNNGCGGAGSDYPNATNLGEFSLNFGANGAVGTQCANADDTDISAVNGVNAIIQIDTKNPGTGQAWPSATQLAENKQLGENANLPGVFGWAATNCTNSQGYPNPNPSCAAPQNAPQATSGTCTAPNTLIAGTNYCAETSAAGTCNNQRAAFTTGGTVKITYKGQVPIAVDIAAGSIFDNAAAKTICPSICTAAKGTWSGQWTNIVTPSVCGCLLP